MKRREFTRMALLGMASGLMAFGQGLEGMESSSLDVQNLIARPACKGKGGCGGFTAERDVHDKASDDEEEEEEDENEDNHDADEADEEHAKPA